MGRIPLIFFKFWVNLADLDPPQRLPHEQYEKRNSRLISFQIAVARKLAETNSNEEDVEDVEAELRLPHIQKSQSGGYAALTPYAHCQLSQQCPLKRELWCPYKMVQRKWYNTDLPCLSSFCPNPFVLLKLKGHTFARDVPSTL